MKVYVCFECDSVLRVQNGRDGDIECGSCGGSYELVSEDQEGGVKGAVSGEVTWTIRESKRGLTATSEGGVVDLAGAIGKK